MNNLNSKNNIWAQKKVWLIMGIGFFSGVFIAFIFFNKPEKIIIVRKPEIINPETGKPISPVKCTIEEGPNQCQIFKKEFKTESIISSTVSQHKNISGTITCCYTDTSSGHAIEICYDIPKGVACPIGVEK